MPTALLTEHWREATRATLRGYQQTGGYRGWDRASEMAPARLREEIESAHLRERDWGGRCVRTQWSGLPAQREKTCLVADGYEGEPGLFKDSTLLRKDPHAVLEGIAIAAKAVGAEEAFLVVREELLQEACALPRALEELLCAGVLGPREAAVQIRLVPVPAGLIPDEPTALFAAIEAQRGRPQRSSLPATQEGLRGLPTVVHNVETLATLPCLLRIGAEAYCVHGTEKSVGTRLVSVSGAVQRPGVYEVEMGTPMLRFLREEAGWMREGRRLLGVLPAGLSAAPLGVDVVERIQFSYESFENFDSRLGSLGLIVLPFDAPVAGLLESLTRYHRRLSCGQCGPCSHGTYWLDQLAKKLQQGEGSPYDFAMLKEVSEAMEDQGICSLPAKVTHATKGFLRVFGQEFPLVQSSSPTNTSRPSGNDRRRRD